MADERTPATITTNNPLGVAPKQGYFSGDPNNPVNQSYFNAAFAGRIHDDKIYKEAYYCNILGNSINFLSGWIDAFMGYDTSCNPEYTLVENHSQNLQIEVASNSTIPTRTNGTGVIVLNANSQFVSGQYILPQIGDTIVLGAGGELATVESISTASSGDAQLTVRQVSTTSAVQSISTGDKLLVLPGKEIQDCEAPQGQFRFDDLPFEHDLKMVSLGNRGELCGDALNKCQFLKLPFTDECGKVYDVWYTKALQDMYRDHEMSKQFRRLLDPNFGLVPTIRARGFKFTPSTDDAITIDDIRDFKREISENGINCSEFAFHCGSKKYSQFMSMLNTAGVTSLNYTLQPLQDCKWLNMEWCGIKVEGLTLHIYEDKTLSNGNLLGAPNYNFSNSAIIIPMCDRTTNCRGGNDTKMITTVYFKDNSGRVWDNLTDSNGVLNGRNGRNTFGAGSEKHEWTIKSRFLQEIHCAECFGYINL